MESQPTTPAITPFPRWQLHVLAVWYLLPLIATAWVSRSAVTLSEITLTGVLVILTSAIPVAVFFKFQESWWLIDRMPWITLAIAVYCCFAGLYTQLYPPETIQLHSEYECYNLAILLLDFTLIYILGSFYLNLPRARALFDK